MPKEYHGASLEEFLDNQSYLKHYGVLGMKWGVRNEETLRKYNGGFGSRLRRKRLESARDSAYRDSENLRKAGYLTESQAVRKVGDKHQTKLERLESIRSEKKRNDNHPSDNNTRTDYSAIRDPYDLSDSELNALNARMQNEINFRQRQSQLSAMTREANKTKTDIARERLASSAIDIGESVIKSWMKTQMIKLLNENLGFGSFNVKEFIDGLKKSSV